MVLFALFAAAVAALFPSPSVFATAAPVKCAVPKPCALFANSSSGEAVTATSAGGTAVLGTSGAGYAYSPGIEGESSNPDGNDAAGAFGAAYFTTGVAPAFGALGYGTTFGMYAETENPGTSSTGYGIGVEGVDAGGTSPYVYNVGVEGSSSNGVGVLAKTNGMPTAGLIGNGFSIGLYAVAKASSSSGNVPIGIEGESDGYPLEVRNTQAGAVGQLLPPGFLLNVYSGVFPEGPYFYVNTSGSAHLSGQLTTSKGVYARTRGRSGVSRIAYGAREAAPEIEDTGEGTLTGGRGEVAFDPAFADSIDPRRSYRVLLTPDGDCKGLYVASKSPGGFTVRELQGGRSSLAFDYRVVATPADESGTRLAAVALLPTRGGRGARAAQAPSRALSPTERLRALLGPQGYAAALAARRERRAGP